MRPTIRLTSMRAALPLFATLFLAPTQPACAQWTILDLGSLEGTSTDSSIAVQINSAAQLVGQSYVSGGFVHAFRTMPGAAIMPADDLGTVPDVFGMGSGFNSTANGINSAGHVAGYGDVPYGGATVLQGFYYGPTGMEPLGRFEEGSYSVATALNDSSNIVGLAFSMAAGSERAVLWPTGGPSFYDLNAFLPGGSPWILTDAYGINTFGDVVGIGAISGVVTGWVWPGLSGEPIPIGPPGSPTFTPLDISDTDHVVGFGPASSGSGATHAFLWIAGSLTDLGTLPLPNKAPSSFARTVNMYGAVVGWTSPYITGGVTVESNAWIWLPSKAYGLPKGLTNLNKAIGAGSGWHLLAAGGINGAGQITGFGINPSGVERGFLLTPPPAKVKSLTLLPSVSGSAVVCGGTPFTGKVTLNFVAPPGGTTVALSTTNPAATVPASIPVPGGASTVSFAGSTMPVGSAASGVVMASAGGGSASYGLTVLPPEPTKVSLAPKTVIGGTTSTGTVTLCGPVAAGTGGLSVTLGSTVPGAATPPASVTVPEGASSASFPVTTFPVTSDTVVAITALANSVSADGTLTVKAPVLKALSISPSTVVGGNPATGTVTLTGAAAADITVPLTNGNPAATMPASVVVPMGSSSVTFPITTTPVASITSGSVSATYVVTKTVTFTVKP